MTALVAAIILLLITYCYGSCMFNDANSNQQLDLTCLEDSLISIFVDNGPNDQSFYNYTVCANNLGCSFRDATPFGMMVQYGYPDNSVCYVNAIFDNGIIQPFYDITTQTWTFNYSNGDSDLFCPENRATQLNFICNSSINEYEIISASEIGGCIYQMNIATRYACQGQTCTTTTLGPTDECIFTTNDGMHTLDISNLKSKVIDAASNNDNTLQYLYTPCTNQVYNCDGIGNMVEIANLTSLTCYKYLAKWDNTIQPIYSLNNNGQWIFTYQNGEQCNGLDSIMRIIWNCDPEAGEAIVTSATRVTDCIYQLIISSKYACG